MEGGKKAEGTHSLNRAIEKRTFSSESRAKSYLLYVRAGMCACVKERKVQT